MLTQARLKELFAYNPETGDFVVAKNRKGSAKKVGAILGSKTKAGYLEADIDGKRYLLHRLAYLYMTGEFPKNYIDHCNRNKMDNRWENLREATQQENMQNDIKPRSHGSLQCRGVYKYGERFRAKIVCNKKQIHLGTFETLKEASNAYLLAKSKFHPMFHA